MIATTVLPVASAVIGRQVRHCSPINISGVTFLFPARWAIYFNFAVSRYVSGKAYSCWSAHDYCLKVPFQGTIWNDLLPFLACVPRLLRFGTNRSIIVERQKRLILAVIADFWAIVPRSAVPYSKYVTCSSFIINNNNILLYRERGTMDKKSAFKSNRGIFSVPFFRSVFVTLWNDRHLNRL